MSANTRGTRRVWRSCLPPSDPSQRPLPMALAATDRCGQNAEIAEEAHGNRSRVGRPERRF